MAIRIMEVVAEGSMLTRAVLLLWITGLSSATLRKESALILLAILTEEEFTLEGQALPQQLLP